MAWKLHLDRRWQLAASSHHSRSSGISHRTRLGSSSSLRSSGSTLRWHTERSMSKPMGETETIHSSRCHRYSYLHTWPCFDTNNSQYHRCSLFGFLLQSSGYMVWICSYSHYKEVFVHSLLINVLLPNKLKQAPTQAWWPALEISSVIFLALFL